MSFASAAEGHRVDLVHDEEGEDGDYHGGRELRPYRELSESAGDGAKEPPRSHLEPVHEAGDGLEFAGDHAEAEEDRPPPEDGQPAEGDAGCDERYPPDYVEELREVESPPVLTLVVAVAIPETASGTAAREAPPAFFHAWNHVLSPIPGCRVFIHGRKDTIA